MYRYVLHMISSLVVLESSRVLVPHGSDGGDTLHRLGEVAEDGSSRCLKGSTSLQHLQRKGSCRLSAYIRLNLSNVRCKAGLTVRGLCAQPHIHLQRHRLRNGSVATTWASHMPRMPRMPRMPSGLLRRNQIKWPRARCEAQPIERLQFDGHCSG